MSELENINITMDKLPAQYEFLSVIASGGMGIIYEARHLVLNQKVAIKMMKTQRLDEKHIKRFRKEADALAALEHPNIIHVRHYGFTDNGQPYMVLDYVEGTSMSQIIQSRGPIPVAFAVEFFAQVADALSHAHERGILHQDLKPSNIMICEFGLEPPYVKLIDFGIAKFINGEATPPGLTDTGDVMGSPAYMSPEQANGGKVDARTDIYSLGCVMFEALTGTQPFTGNTALEIIAHQINTKAPSLQERSLEEFPPDLSQIVAKTLEKNPEKRFQSMTELRHALLDVKCNQDKPLEQTTNDHPSQKSLAAKADPQKAKMLIISGITLALAVICCNIFMLVANVSRQKEIAEQHQKIKDEAEAAGRLSFSSDDTARQMIREAFQNYDLKGRFQLSKMAEYGDRSLDEFGRLPARGTRFSLDSSSIKGPGLAYLIRYHVVMLNLNDSNCTDRGLLEIKHMKWLRELQLDNTAVTKAGLSELKNMPKLERLSLRVDHLDDEAMRIVAQNSKIKHLQVGRNPSITAVGYSYLKDLKSLEFLDVMENPVDLKVANAIAHLSQITFLSFEYTKIKDDALKEICGMRWLRSIELPSCESVNLESDRQLNDKDFEFIKSCPHLKDVDIRGTNAGDRTMELVANSGVINLYIQNTKVTDRGLLSLVKNKSLKLVEVTRNQFSQEATDKFDSLRPGVRRIFETDRMQF
jgi:serine/threonine protein kinase